MCNTARARLVANSDRIPGNGYNKSDAILYLKPFIWDTLIATLTKTAMMAHLADKQRVQLESGPYQNLGSAWKNKETENEPRTKIPSRRNLKIILVISARNNIHTNAGNVI